VAIVVQVQVLFCSEVSFSTASRNVMIVKKCIQNKEKII